VGWVKKEKLGLVLYWVLKKFLWNEVKVYPKNPLFKILKNLKLTLFGFSNSNIHFLIFVENFF